MKAVQFGGGNIGRGFTGQLLSETGFDVVFVDVVEELVGLLNQRREYPIRIACDQPYDVIVRNVRAVNGRDVPAVAAEIVDADVLCTAVGVNVLPFIAPTIAAGIKARHDAGCETPVNIIICENMQGAQDFLKEKVLAALPADVAAYLEAKVGFVMSVVGRMVPVMTEEQKAEDPLLVVVEPYKHLPIDKAAIKGTLPEIVGVEPAGNFQGYVDRKLYTHNAGHAASAYLGFLKGYDYIWEAMGDAQVNGDVRKALAETGEALIKKHGFSPEEHQAHIEDLLQRFANRALADQVARVGKDPVRKLGPTDRLIGGAKLALEYGVKPEGVCKAIAAALKFTPSDDPTSPRMQELLKAGGPANALREVSELDECSEITKEVIAQYERL